MKTILKCTLASGAALAIAACTPAETDGDAMDDADTVEMTDEAAPMEGDDMMASDEAAMPDAETEAADFTEENERDPHGNPIGPMDAEQEE